MERCISVRFRVAQLLIIGALTLAAQASAEDAAVVLVIGKDSPIENISSLDMRKIYFGISVSIDGHTIHGLRRRDDERLNQIFMQSVIAMSQRSYERRLLSLTLKLGTPRPVEVDDRDELLRLLVESPSTLAYMWKSNAETDPRVRIIRVLWQET
jgi:hypothetical protein